MRSRTCDARSCSGQRTSGRCGWPATIRPFLAARGHSPAEVEAMFNAWLKAVTLQAALWCAPYLAPAGY
jgi:hypothetical protein